VKSHDALVLSIPILMITFALLLACASALAPARNARIVRRGAASCSSLSAVADDPFFFPFGDMPTVPRERQMVARDFRAWGIPQRIHSAGCPPAEESGGRPASLSGTAVVLTFPKRRV
jgi:hypothetical protein